MLSQSSQVTPPPSFKILVMNLSRAIIGLLWLLIYQSINQWLINGIYRYAWPGVTVVVSFLRNRTAERRGRQTAFVWQTWQGYYLRSLRVSSRSSLNITVCWSFTKISAYTRGRWSLAENASKHNYCHACQTRFAVVFLLPSHCVRKECPRRK